MPFRIVYLTADISALSRISLDNAKISAVRYTNVNGIVSEQKISNAWYLKFAAFCAFCFGGRIL